jgi:hypothetical protein
MQITRWCPFKIKKNVQRPNTEALLTDQHHFQPTLVFAGQYLQVRKSSRYRNTGEESFLFARVVGKISLGTK